MLRLLLNAYPAVDNLTEGWRDQLPALQRAAAGTNVEVLQLMREHIELNQVKHIVPYNYIHLRHEIPEGPVLLTALDCCRYGMIVPEFDKSAIMTSQDEDGGSVRLTTFEKQQKRSQRKGVYRYLRDQGAVHGWELDGYFIR
jgi:hypothetical protein